MSDGALQRSSVTTLGVTIEAQNQRIGRIFRAAFQRLDSSERDLDGALALGAYIPLLKPGRKPIGIRISAPATWPGEIALQRTIMKRLRVVMAALLAGL